MSASISPRHAPGPIWKSTPAAELRLGGLARLSTCDWPGELAAVVFCQGCGWRCRYCQNAHLLAAEAPGTLAWAEVKGFLEGRRGLLDGVVFSGGEPTLQPALAAAMGEVRALGFRVGLHTAGPSPERLAAVLPLLDWVGFDVKAPFAAYERVTGEAGSGAAARESLRRLLASGVAFEARTTVHPLLLDAGALAELAAELAAMGVAHYALQAFRPQGCRDAELNAVPPGVPALPPPLAARFAGFTVRT